MPVLISGVLLQLFLVIAGNGRSSPQTHSYFLADISSNNHKRYCLRISLRINQQAINTLPYMLFYSDWLKKPECLSFLAPVVRLQAPAVGTIGQAHQDMPILHIVCGVLSAHFSTSTNKNYFRISLTVTDLLSYTTKECLSPFCRTFL